MSRNFLDAETSPYLLQHKDNPVHWRPWNRETIAEAERTGKPLFVSVGYAACHWCHVMAHESFEDAETAALMNDLYIPVKIDREERPDIDQWLQTAISALGGQGGWPLSAFLTPSGKPFWAGTYFPKEAAYGRPPFKTVLQEIAARFRDARQDADNNAEQIAQAVERTWNMRKPPSGNQIAIDDVALQTARRFDVFYGGFSGAPKFPNVSSIELLWRAYLRTGMLQYFQLAMITLEHMCAGGIYDHLGGGFHRYSTDERWLVPHFEKMLYDNAELIGILTLAWQHTRLTVFSDRIAETIEWLLRDMRVEDGGFASSLNADSEGAEGKFYVWSEAEIDAALKGTFASRFKEAYGVTAQGNFEGHNILHRVVHIGTLSPADEQLLAKQRQLLLGARDIRVHPTRDDKVLANWNGLVISSLAFAGTAFRNADWVQAARTAFQFVINKLGEGDRLYHSYRAGKRQHKGFADDYANMIRAAMALWEATYEPAYLKQAIAWTAALDRHFWDEANHGYRYTPDDGDNTGPVFRSAGDVDIPSANGTMIGALARLALATGNQEYAVRANLIVQTFTGDLLTNFLHMTTFLNAFDFFYTTIQIVIIGASTDSRTHDLVAAVRGRSLPNRFLMVVKPDQELPEGHPAKGMGLLNGQPTAYICVNNTCSQPLTSPVALSQSLLLQPLPGTGAVRPG